MLSRKKRLVYLRICIDFVNLVPLLINSLYEDHGDTLALQYGGSQLVHRIKTYRKTAPWTSQGNDIMQTLSRYYSNTFSDAEKQNTINLFLGLFQPEEHQPQIWDYTTDYYFHHKPIIYRDTSLTQWWDPGVLKCLPYAYNDLTKACFEIIQIHSKHVEMIDSYLDYYRPYELSLLSDVYATTVSNSIRDFMPNFTTNYSPFSIRVRPVKRREENSNKNNTMKNPSVTGQSSTSSAASSTSSDEADSGDEDSLQTSQTQLTSKECTPEPMTFGSLFPTMRDVYGTELMDPGERDIKAYKKYILIGKKANGTATNSFTPISIVLKTQSHFKEDTSIQTIPATIKKESINVYNDYISLGKTGGLTPKQKDIDIYQKYVSLC